MRKPLAEESGAAKRVDQKFSFARKNPRDQIGKGLGDLVVGLGKDTRARMRAQSVMTVSEMSRAQLHESSVDFGCGDRAALDVHHRVDVTPVESDDVVFCVDCDSIP